VRERVGDGDKNIFCGAVIILYYTRWQHKNKKNTAVKMKNTHNYRRKRKTIKSQSEWGEAPVPVSFSNIHNCNIWKGVKSGSGKCPTQTGRGICPGGELSERADVLAGRCPTPQI